MLRVFGILVLALTCVSAARGCTCVTAEANGGQEANHPNSYYASGFGYIFEGRVISTEKLPAHPEMRGRARHAVTLQVSRYWVGQPGRRITIYVLDPGTDCLGGTFDVGKTYLVFANVNKARDLRFDDFFWYGWLDLMKEGDDIIEPVTACVPTGEVDKLKGVLSRLGKGQVPK